MRHIILGDSSCTEFSVAVLIKDTSLKSSSLHKYVLSPLESIGFNGSILGVGLPYGGQKKVKMKECKEFLEEALPQLIDAGVTYILCCDTDNYFKALTKAKKVTPFYGYSAPCLLKGFEDTGLQIFLCPAYTSLFFDPSNQRKIDLALKALSDSCLSQYTVLGQDVIHEAYYPEQHEIKEALQELHHYPLLAVDVETFSLRHYEAGIGTISFAWNQHEGLAFAVDCLDQKRIPNPKVKALLKEFFTEYQGTLLAHNANFDLKILVYELWMDDLLDQKGLLEGLDIITRKFHCTKVISYLATNSCTGNSLGLKNQAHEHGGNWAEDNIDDITLIEPSKLLRYNLIDTLCTHYVFNKNYKIMQNTDQIYPYETVFHPSIKTLIQTELTGNPLDMDEVKKTKQILLKQQTEAEENFHSLTCVKAYMAQEGIDKVNLNSGKQLQKIIYTYLEYPVTNFTKAQQPSTDATALKDLKSRAKESEHYELFMYIIAYAEVATLLTNFIKNFLLAPQAKDGWHYLFGSFNIGGAISGRLSSSNINLNERMSVRYMRAS